MCQVINNFIFGEMFMSKPSCLKPLFYKYFHQKGNMGKKENFTHLSQIFTLWQILPIVEIGESLFPSLKTHNVIRWYEQIPWVIWKIAVSKPHFLFFTWPHPSESISVKKKCVQLYNFTFTIWDQNCTNVSSFCHVIQNLSHLNSCFFFSG